MLLEPDGKILRFGLRSAGLPVSPLWRMWVQGDETYLAARNAIGIAKISLHSTGHWAFTAGTGRLSVSGPRQLIGDWVVGPRIVFPGIAPEMPLGSGPE